MTSVDASTSRVVLNGLNPRLAYWVSVSGSTAAGTSTNNARQLAQIPPPIGKCDDLRKNLKLLFFSHRKCKSYTYITSFLYCTKSYRYCHGSSGNISHNLCGLSIGNNSSSSASDEEVSEQAALC